MVARAVWDREVAGSNPVAPTKEFMAKKYQVVGKILRGLAYCSVLLQWFFLATIYLSIISEYKWFNDLVSPPVETPVAPVGSSTLTITPLLGWIISALVIIVLLVAIIYTFRRLPGSIVRGGDNLTNKPADLLAPVLLKFEHCRPTKRRRLVLTRRIVLIAKALLVTLPLALLLPVNWLGWPMEATAAWTVALFLAFSSATPFVIEYLLGQTLQARSRKAD